MATAEVPGNRCSCGSRHHGAGSSAEPDSQVPPPGPLRIPGRAAGPCEVAAAAWLCQPLPQRQGGLCTRRKDAGASSRRAGPGSARSGSAPSGGAVRGVGGSRGGSHGSALDRKRSRRVPDPALASGALRGPAPRSGRPLGCAVHGPGGGPRSRGRGRGSARAASPSPPPPPPTPRGALARAGARALRAGTRVRGAHPSPAARRARPGGSGAARSRAPASGVRRGGGRRGGRGAGWAAALGREGHTAPGPGVRGPRLQEALPAPRSAFPRDHCRAAQTPGGPAKRPRARSPLPGPLPAPPSLCWRGAAAGSPPQTRAVAPRVRSARFTCSGCARPAATPAGRSRSPLTRSDPGRCDHRRAARLGPHIHELQGGLPKTTLPPPPGHPALPLPWKVSPTTPVRAAEWPPPADRCGNSSARAAGTRRVRGRKNARMETTGRKEPFLVTGGSQENRQRPRRTQCPDGVGEPVLSDHPETPARPCGVRPCISVSQAGEDGSHPKVGNTVAVCSVPPSRRGHLLHQGNTRVWSEEAEGRARWRAEPWKEACAWIRAGAGAGASGRMCGMN
ncbi:uncharacterized protein LOC141584967 [Saimiri boliviensis]|uniref:uncharacterized protein LOC141584967 n=1 Tax=Saimiri boliviensis TaxID=27679 RepID=UPI003D77338F